MFKRLGIAFALCIAIGSAAAAQERIAVLDTVLPKGMDAGVVIPVTEKIMEEFVRSKLFVVLDRSFIAKTLSEQEFSTSDLTSGDSAKLATIGGFLKATYIVVSTVQKLDTRYFLSAKMIEVKSGVIVAQSSVDRDGTISVLISMAGELGQKLVAASMGQDAPKSSGRTAAQPTQAAAPQQSAPAAQATAPQPPRTPKPHTGRFSSVALEIGVGATIATFLGNTYDQDLYSGSVTSSDAVTGTDYGISVILPSGLFYISAGLTVTDSTYSGSTYDTYTESIVASFGAGIDVPIGPVLTYAGIRGSYLFFNWVEDGSLYYEGDWSGLCYGLEFGGDYRLGMFEIGLRYTFDMGTITDSTGSWVDLDIATGALSMRLGYAF